MSSRLVYPLGPWEIKPSFQEMLLGKHQFHAGHVKYTQISVLYKVFLKKDGDRKSLILSELHQCGPEGAERV